MEIDASDQRVLTRDECLALLSKAEIGRIAISARALPLILPVPYAVADDRIVIATQDGTTLDAATRDTVVAFETDGPSGDGKIGWSVHVAGIAHHVTDTMEIDRLAELPLGSSNAPAPATFVAISTDHLWGWLAVEEDAGVGPSTLVSGVPAVSA
jgi:nitroimidazol reductase NimA-like FMN-containing flavoprotein (pyridoxamine 5'-phosphate oxidase superfamily)